MYIKNIMLSANVTDFRKEMKKYMDLVIEDFETLIINRGKGKGAVLISLPEYNSLMETMYLLSSKANADNLYQAMEDVREGKVVKKTLDELWKYSSEKKRG
jgi:antitoxin YefM